MTPDHYGTRHKTAAAENLLLGVYVPATPCPRSVFHIRPRSAIVGLPLEADPTAPLDPSQERVHVHYEGGGADNVRTYADRLLHASGRLVTRYPTIAQAWIPRADLVRVGTLAYGTQVLAVTDRTALDAWLDAPALPPAGGPRAVRATRTG